MTIFYYCGNFAKRFKNNIAKDRYYFTFVCIYTFNSENYTFLNVSLWECIFC